MCGISGFINLDTSINKDYFINTLHNMNNSLYHRGPNQNGTFLDGIYNSKKIATVGLAHTRLSIRDLSGGTQPMSRYYKGRKYTIVYNGELYNTNELKVRLLEHDINLLTTGDTEIILFSYIIWGVGIFKELNGIFSFCIFDGEKIILARDHLGVKPLFYYFDSKKFIFSSEIKGIFKCDVKPSIDNNSWNEIIGLGPAHTPGCGVFKDINEVLPGQYLIININSDYSFKIINKYFWKLTAKEHTDNYSTTIEKCSYLITDSVKRQMVSDIPICTFLSGGLDSSLVTSIVAHNMDEPLNTYSFDFKNNNINFKANSFQSSLDRPFVDIMTKYLSTHHKYLECNNDIQINYLYKAVDARDMPCMADVESSMLYFCELVSKDCNVCLTGECADEIFGGYPWFHKDEMLNATSFPWSANLDFRKSLFKKDFIESLNMDEYVNCAYENTMNSFPKLYNEKEFEYKRRKNCWLNINWFMATLLNRMDRCGMYSSLEARVPFADYRILEYVYNVPWEYKCYNGQAKNLLVQCGKKYLPDEVLYRKKSPYPKTYDPNYEAMLGQMILDMYHNTPTILKEIIDYNKLTEFVNSPKDYGKPWYGQLMAGPQMLAYLLQIEYWLTKFNL